MSSSQQQDSSKSSLQTSMAEWVLPLLDVLEMLARKKFIILGFLALGCALALWRLANLEPFYRASTVAVLMSREKPNLDAAIDTSSLETSEDRAGRSTAGNLMLPPDPTLYTTLIKSRAVLSKIADQFRERLQSHISERDRSDEIVSGLSSMIEVSSTEEGLITVTVTAAQPDLAADMANALVAECMAASQNIERHLLLQQAGYLEEALASAQARLEEKEALVTRFSEEFGVINPDLQISNIYREIRDLRIQRDQLMRERQRLLVSYTEKAPEMRLVDEEIAETERQIQALQKQFLGSLQKERAGGAVIDFETLRQQLQYERDLVSTLAAREGIFRIRAEQPTGSLAVIRAATPPDRPAGPSKKTLVILSVGICLFVGLGLAIVTAQVERALQHPSIARKTDAIIEATLSHLPLGDKIRERFSRPAHH